MEILMKENAKILGELEILKNEGSQTHSLPP